MNERSEIQVESVGNCLIARLTGCLNSVLGGQLLDKVKTQLELCHGIIMDLAGLRYMDSAGLGALVSIQMTMKRKGYPLILVGLQGPPLEVMRSSQLLRIFEVQDSVEAALAQIDESK